MARLEMRRGASVGIEVISSLWDSPIEFVTRDLSPRGAYVVSELLPDAGEHVICSFDLGSICSVEFFAEVMRVNLMRRVGDMADPGFGVRFLDTGPLDRLRIRRAIDGLPPPLPVGFSSLAGGDGPVRRWSIV